MAFTFFRRFLVRLVVTSYLTTLAVFVALDLSIAGGYRSVLMPMGANPASERDMATVEQFHLDDPLVVRHALWAADAVQGDLGRSIRRGTPVTGYITHRLTISLELAFAGMVLAVVVGVPLGLLAAGRDGTASGRLLTSFLSVAQSLPVFMTATILIYVFAVKLGWSRASGWTRFSDSLSGNAGGLLLPAIAIAFAEAGIIARVVRAGVVDVMREDYVIAAMSKGMSRGYVLFRHALRPGSLSLLTVLSLSISSMMAGSFIVEIVFAVGGLGQALIDASVNRDLNLLLGLTVYTVGVYVVVSAIIDLVMLWADPRIRRV